MMKIYSLYNKKVGFYNPPTFSQMSKEDVQINLLRYCAMNKDQARAAHYDECELYYLGEFNDLTAEHKLLDKPEYLCTLTEAFGNE